MFVQSARFVERHAHRPADELSVFGQERVAETVRLAKMNLAVHGLAGDIREANSYYDNLHDAVGAFDFVMANPPFNVNRVDRERLRDDKSRYPFGMPAVDNANYLWIQLFYSSLNEAGRAGFVMANSAGDARGSEQAIRQRLIEAGAVDVVVAVASNFFYTVTLPVTLWFLDRGKTGTRRADTLLFVDARPIFRQVGRALRDFTDEQLEFISNIVRAGMAPGGLMEARFCIACGQPFTAAGDADRCPRCAGPAEAERRGSAPLTLLEAPLLEEGVASRSCWKSADGTVSSARQDTVLIRACITSPGTRAGPR